MQSHSRPLRERPTFPRAQWDPVFGEQSVPEEDGPYIYELEKMPNAHTDDVITLFLRERNSVRPSQKFKEVVSFCNGASLSELNDDEAMVGKAIDATRQSVWLLDISSNTGSFRRYEKSLSVSEFRHHLKQERFKHLSLPDADRRLMHIVRLNPYHALVLAETAYKHQVPALKYALWSYIDFRPSLMARINPKGYSVFELQFHIPYYALEEIAYENFVVPHRSKARKKPMDAKFLTGIPSVIYKAQASFMICGANVKQWNAYSFVDEDHDDEDEEEGEEEEDEEEEFVGDEDVEEEGDNGPYENFVIDRIAGTDSDVNMCDNPREYFLTILRVLISRILIKWGHLVRWIENGIEECTDVYPCLSSSSFDARCRLKDVETALQWTINALGLLKTLRGLLLNTTDEWKAFKDPDGGGFDFFSDLFVDPPSSKSETHILHTFQEIDGEYKELRNLQQKIESLINRCTTYSERAQFHQQSLQNQLAVESSKAAQESSLAAKETSRAAQETNRAAQETSRAAQRNGSATDFTILAISPVAVVTAFFNVPESVIPSVGRTSRSFIFCVAVVAAAFWALLCFARSHQKVWQWLFWLTKKIRMISRPRKNAQGTVTLQAEITDEIALQEGIQRGYTGVTLVGLDPASPLQEIVTVPPRRDGPWAPTKAAATDT